MTAEAVAARIEAELAVLAFLHLMTEEIAMRHARADYERFQDPAGLIPDDEPVFLIRGQDTLAPDVLRFYAKEARTAGLHDVADATEGHAEAMERWHRERTEKLPDL